MSILRIDDLTLRQRERAQFLKTLKEKSTGLAGSFMRVIWAQKGDTVDADFGSLGRNSLQFV